MLVYLLSLIIKSIEFDLSMNKTYAELIVEILQNIFNLINLHK